MNNTATSAELLEGLAELLRGAAQQTADRRQRFELRVGLNLLGMLQREQALDAQAAAAEAQRLRGLLGEGAGADLEADRAALCRRIADGSLDMQDAALRDHLWRTTLDRLAIDQPGYRWRRS